MTQQTAMQIMYDELMAHEYTIPISLIVKCKELIDVEKEQIIDAFDCDGSPQSGEKWISNGEQYYNEKYNK